MQAVHHPQSHALHVVFIPHLLCINLIFLLVGRGADPFKQHDKEPKEISSLHLVIFLHLSRFCCFRFLFLNRSFDSSHLS
jgi:hypothetical protein